MSAPSRLSASSSSSSSDGSVQTMCRIRGCDGDVIDFEASTLWRFPFLDALVKATGTDSPLDFDARQMPSSGLRALAIILQRLEQLQAPLPLSQIAASNAVAYAIPIDRSPESARRALELPLLHKLIGNDITVFMEPSGQAARRIGAGSDTMDAATALELCRTQAYGTSPADSEDDSEDDEAPRKPSARQLQCDLVLETAHAKRLETTFALRRQREAQAGERLRPRDCGCIVA